ncbi:unnamed protein product [Symbiodinium sp. CCMP2592]|nr:unnamed protein product [Symbiodinium sp. CCMP2592]
MEGRQGDVSIDAGIQATQGMSLSKPLPDPAWSDQARGGIFLSDLPLQDVKCDSAKHIVDIISDVPPPDKTSIEAAINSGHCGKDRLPEPFCVKSDVEVKLITQFVVISQNNANVSVLKHMYSPDTKLTKACLECLCYGTPYVLKWQGHAQNFRRGFQWFLEQLGGWQCRHHALTHMLPCHQPRPDGSKSGSYMANLSEEAVDKSFAFIEEEASRLGTEWKRVQWMTKNLNTNPESPIYAWGQDVEYSVLDFAVRHMLKHMKTHSNGFVGSPGQAGRKDRPDMHDDGCLASEPIRKMKGFADVRCIAMTRECWGAAKFVQRQMRLFACNDFEFTPWLNKHQRIRGGCAVHMKHEDFLGVIKPMRVNILVNAGTIMLFRSATQEEISVPGLVMDSHLDFLKPASAKRYNEYRDGIKSTPSAFDEDLKWEVDYVNAILTGNPRAIHELFHGSSHRPTGSFSASSLPSSSVNTATAVKEQPRPFRRALSTLSSEIIDLGTQEATVKEEEEVHDPMDDLAFEPQGISQELTDFTKDFVSSEDLDDGLVACRKELCD